ncbi:hypothetical protein BDM02DRAFT_3115525 [Thelephora ganbajun]|uniref:Uncharacterized protein n=1 Tax=Thelephora ganbajun TaxID=370292 RepID=A0ACB6ZFE0_THEGA|nr:hypothetical protein BDM02DRAFT_3115525 [Thelephora ganbajun]
MLVLHPTSNCDICYDTYSQENPASTIPCGHIFCYRCISVCRPSICPLCRKKFSSSYVTKLRTADVGDGGSEAVICSPVSATSSTSSCQFVRRDSLRGKDFDDRVAAHIKETGEMIKEVTERVYLQHAIEATLRAKLTEVELERDTLLSGMQLSAAEDSLRASKRVEESLINTLQRTIEDYEACLDEMETKLDEAKLTEDRLCAEMSTLRLERNPSPSPSATGS